MSDQIRAPGSDPDSRRRELKMRMAAAETRGDTVAVAELRAALEALDAPDGQADVAEAKGKRSREQAASARREATETANGDAKTVAPAGRTSAPKDTTAADTGGK